MTPRRDRRASTRRRFTVEGDPSDVIALAEASGWKMIRHRWWQRTYPIPRWLVWLVGVIYVLNLPRDVETWLRWLSWL